VTPNRIASIALAALLATAAPAARAQMSTDASAAETDSATTDTTAARATDPATTSRADSVATSPADSAATVRTDSTRATSRTGHGASEAERRKLKETMRNVGRNEVAGASEWERRKNPRLAMLCNALLPGLGQTYNGRRLKVAVMVGFFSFYGGNMVLAWQRHQYYEALRDLSPPGSSAFALNDQLSLFYQEQAKDFLWWTSAVWLLGIIDAWVDAHLYDVRAYTPDAPAAPKPGRVDTPGMRVGVDARGRDKYVVFTIGF
jgi:hypothetical protein